MLSLPPPKTIGAVTASVMRKNEGNQGRDGEKKRIDEGQAALAAGHCETASEIEIGPLRVWVACQDF